MPRVMCVWFPNWPVQRLQTERPELSRSELVLFAGPAHRPVVVNCTTRSESHGIQVGQPLAEARALRPHALYLAADDETDRDALRGLAIECQRFTPLVGLEEGPRPSSLLALVDGCTHLWKDEARFLRHVRRHWVRRGFRIRLALAGSIGAAWALAHCAAFTVVPAGEEEAALSGLSVASMRVPRVVLERLEALGLPKIGDVLRLPREGLISRFGSALTHRIDQLLGLRPESFLCERSNEPLSVVREWETPIDDRTALLHLCKEMLRELLGLADRHGLGIQELEGTIQTESEPVLVQLRLVEPTREAGHLAQLLELHLERQAWTGGVVAVRWTAPRLGRIAAIQGSWLDDDADFDRSRTFNALVDRLSSRLAAEAVLRVEVLPDPQPECTTRLVPWADAGASRPDSFSLAPDQSRGRPMRLLGIPQPIMVIPTHSAGPPIQVVWQGQNHRVVRCWGPERIATGWWRGQDVQRDYFRAEWDQGTQAWLYRELKTGRWFLHGFFD